MPKEVKWAISIAVGLGLLALGWRVYFVLVTLHVVICGLLIMVIMLQSGEAADLAGAFGGAGSQTAFGPRGAATFLSKATTWCAIMFMLTAMVLVLRQDRAEPQGSSILQRFSKPAPPAPKTPAPVTQAPPAQTPAQQPPASQQQPQSQQPAPSSSAPASPPAQTPPAKKP